MKTSVIVVQCTKDKANYSEEKKQKTKNQWSQIKMEWNIVHNIIHC